MTKETVKEFLPLVQALVEGKTIQFKASDEWTDCADTSFAYPASFYRIKPEPKEWFEARMHHYCLPTKFPTLADAQDFARGGNGHYAIVHCKEVL